MAKKKFPGALVSPHPRWPCHCIHMLYLNQAIGQFQKRLAAIIAVKCGHVEQHSVQAFIMTAALCSE